MNDWRGHLFLSENPNIFLSITNCREENLDTFVLCRHIWLGNKTLRRDNLRTFGNLGHHHQNHICEYYLSQIIKLDIAHSKAVKSKWRIKDGWEVLYPNSSRFTKRASE